MKQYDYLIVGAGFYGSVFARQMMDAGRSCLVVDSREHIGGNCYTDNVNSIHVHRYGAHVFHCNNQFVWDYVNRFADFNGYINRVKVSSGGRIYSFPINLFTLHQMWGVTTPREAAERLEGARVKTGGNNFEEVALAEIGTELYEKFFKGYTEKQWQRPATELPASIFKRLPIRCNFDDNYFSDRYQGIPIGGYTAIFQRLLEGADVRLGCDYFENRDLDDVAGTVVYTGPIDRYFDYKYGELEYRTLRFEHQVHNVRDFQGNAVINYADRGVPWTRSIEHKHFEFGKQDFTVITKEYPDKWDKSKIPYYPVNTGDNNAIHAKYLEEWKAIPKRMIGGGRLFRYRYFDMHQVIASALQDSGKELSNAGNVRPLP